VTPRTLLRLTLAWLCARAGAHVRGWCPCPLCDPAEQSARLACGMTATHPEFVTRRLGEGAEAWLSAVAVELWPAYEYASIIGEFREGRS
jgi:hypothetical protein